MKARSTWADRWPTVRLAHLFEPRTETGEPALDVLSVYRDYGVIRKSSRDDNFNRTPDDLSRYQVVHPGDLVVNRMKAWQGSLGVSAYRGLVSPDYEVLQPTATQWDMRFLHHLLRSRPMIGEYAVRSTGIRPSQWRLYWAQMRMIDVPVPELHEQRQIADFLDCETARINTLIDEQQRLIETLKERRAGVIADAVTHGVDGGTLGSNQIRWLGPTPAHWRLGKVKHLGDVTLGKMLQTSDSGSDVRAPYMRAANVQPDGVLREDDVKEMWFSASELASLDLRRGDVVVVEGGIGGYGRAAYLKHDLQGWGFQNSINRIRPNQATDGRYLAYFLIMARIKGFIEAYCNVVSMPHLTAEKLNAMPVPIPPLKEQQRIADYLDEQTSKIDTLTAETEQLINLVRERRTALITAAVTGQIDVRDEAA